MFYTHNRILSIKGFYRTEIRKVVVMKKFKLTKILSLALATVIAFTAFSFNSLAASRANEYKRDLTDEEIQTIYTMFDATYYAKTYRDVVDTLGTDDAATMFSHFINSGIWEERQPSAVFNVDVYATRNVDLRAEYGDDIIAYYMYYATHEKEQTWRVTPTLADAFAHACTIYSVYDLVKGSTTEVKAGAWPMQTATYAPNLGIK